MGLGQARTLIVKTPGVHGPIYRIDGCPITADDVSVAAPRCQRKIKLWGSDVIYPALFLVILAALLTCLAAAGFLVAIIC